MCIMHSCILYLRIWQNITSNQSYKYQKYVWMNTIHWMVTNEDLQCVFLSIIKKNTELCSFSKRWERYAGIRDELSLMSLMLAGTAQILPLLMYIPVICIFSYWRMSYNFLTLTTPIIIEKNMETTCYSRFEMKIIWINYKNCDRTFAQLYWGLVSLKL